MIIIDYKDRRPIYEQIIERFQELIVKGVLKPDSQLPSVRNLAMELSINPNTIQKAYAELERQGYLYSVKGRGSFVSFNDNLLQVKREQFKEELGKLVRKARDLKLSKEELTAYVADCYEREDVK
ncbi:MAG: GntR family transcriptional regulator [Lachnospiraceae bacterium]|nr:GntR family transcriptional regulator [Lachnospiraceae bacterium]